MAPPGRHGAKPGSDRAVGSSLAAAPDRRQSSDGVVNWRWTGLRRGRRRGRRPRSAL